MMDSKQAGHLLFEIFYRLKVTESFKKTHIKPLTRILTNLREYWNWFGIKVCKAKRLLHIIGPGEEIFYFEYCWGRSWSPHPVIFHSTPTELSQTITATNCFLNLNLGEGREASNISNENSFYISHFQFMLGILEKNQQMFARKYFLWLSNKLMFCISVR